MAEEEEHHDRLRQPEVYGLKAGTLKREPVRGRAVVDLVVTFEDGSQLAAAFTVPTEHQGERESFRPLLRAMLFHFDRKMRSILREAGWTP